MVFTFCQIPINRVLVITTEDTRLITSYLHVIGVHILVCRTNKPQLLTYRFVCMKSKLLTALIYLCKISYNCAFPINEPQQKRHYCTSSIFGKNYPTLLSFPTVTV